MSENKFKGPTVMYGPKGESAVFDHHAEVPEGWLDDPAKHESAPQTGTRQVELDMTKAEITAALQSGGVPFDPRAKAAALYAVLTEAVQKALTEAEITFDPAMPTKQLLELLPTPE